MASSSKVCINLVRGGGKRGGIVASSSLKLCVSLHHGIILESMYNLCLVEGGGVLENAHNLLFL